LSRERVYEDAAQRQRAYRERLREGSENPKHRPKRPRSRPEQLNEAIRILKALQTGYERWRDRLPDFLEGSEQETKVSETIEELSEAIERLCDLELPKGFGRD
jgi:hypothetical protein